jgi:hypothetical protein
MAFKLSKEQVTERAALAAELRTKGAALNIAIVAFKGDRTAVPGGRPGAGRL